MRYFVQAFAALQPQNRDRGRAGGVPDDPCLAGLNIVDQDFTFFVSGTAGGVPGTFPSTGETMRIEAGTDPATGALWASFV